MARLEDRKRTGSSGGYERLFGIKALGALMSKIQGTVIAPGSKLERMIQNRHKGSRHADEQELTE